MIRYTTVVLAALFIPSFLFAGAGKPDIVVITQNQYLGADLTPIIAAESPGEYNLAVLDALFSIADNNIPERAVALAKSLWIETHTWLDSRRCLDSKVSNPVRSLAPVCCSMLQ